MRFLVTVAAAGAMLAGCVETDLGHLPLLCHQGEPRCPSGYSCEKHVTLGEVCLKDGTALPDLFVPVFNEAGGDVGDAGVADLGPESGVDSGPDGGVPDGPLLDTQPLDGPGLDAPLTDGPGLDAPVQDGPSMDAAPPDGPSPDQAAQVDQSVVDLALTPDAGCGSAKTWTLWAGGSSLDYAQGVAVDGAGNSYLTGYFSGTADFGAYKLTSAGATDLFVAKVSPAGSILWAVSAGGTSPDVGTSIAVDTLGNSYITGSFSGTAKFGTVSLTTLGTNDIFVAKLDGTGKFLWALFTQGTTKDMTPHIAVDGKGQAHITGYVTGQVAATGASFNWTAYLSGSASDIAMDAAGNSYIAGTFTGNAKFGSTTLTAVSSGDLFVARLDSKGTATMATKAAGQVGSYANAQAIALNAAGEIAVAGGFRGTQNFGITTLKSLGTGQKEDLFVARLKSNGSFVWAVSAGGVEHDTANGVVLEGGGGVQVAGSFVGSATFGGTKLQAQGGGSKSDLFWARVSASGAFTAATGAGGSDLDLASGLGLDAAGYTYLLGVYKGSASFGATSLTTKGNFDVFLSRLDLCGKF